mmetsp:Transcript_41803/g.99158  ORF Transcript_41803/g.99158 Transcript_41803/m.99158 type:complete len:575 (+) Transcript_41803:83-1807(+)
MTSDIHSIKKFVAVVGCGPAGLAAVKELKQAGFYPVAFDKHARIGGVWAWGWDSLVMTSSSVHTAFSDFPPEGNLRMWTRDEYWHYLEKYCTAFDLWEHIHTNTKVLKAWREPPICEGTSNLWQVVVEGPLGKTTWGCCALVIATGVNQVPTYPVYPGFETFTGKVLHTRDYRSDMDFTGKRAVLVGMGESGSDISYDAARQCAETFISIRKTAGWVVPRLRNSTPADIVTNRILWGLPRRAGPWLSRAMATGDSVLDRDEVIKEMGKYNFAVLEKGSNRLGVYGTFGTKNTSFLKAMVKCGAKLKPEIIRLGPGKSVHFADSTVTEADVLLFNTGFRYDFSFIQPSADDVELKQALEDAKDVRNLWKKVLHPAVGASLCFVGFARPAFGSQPPMAEMQARLCAFALGSNGAGLPPRDVMELQIELDRDRIQRQFGAEQRVRSLDDYVLYLNDVASIIGCHPGSIWWLALSSPRLAWNVMAGPHIVAQFRLRGPGCKPALAAETLQRSTLPFARLCRIRLFVISAALWLLCALLSTVLGASWRPVGFEAPTGQLSVKQLREELERRRRRNLILP